jgi:alpha-ketoglutarate-dependent taurine dioxygenase
MECKSNSTGQPVDKDFLLQVDSKGLKPTDWAQQQAPDIQQRLDKDGLLLLRGLNILGSKQFGQVLSQLFGEKLLDYTYRSTPRAQIRGNVYTATEYHHDEVILQHNESAYANVWAMRLGFLCMLPAQEGGATPITDSIEVYNAIPADIREEFERKQIEYVRHYGNVDLPWQEVFQTTEKVDVEAYCRANNIQCQWLDSNELRTSQVNPAVCKHPITGNKTWFNQAHLFHGSNYSRWLGGTDSAEVLQQLPRNARYGDGTAIEQSAIDLINNIYKEQSFYFDWQKGDLLLVDNMRFAHGRQPYKGNRKVLVGMACEHGHVLP